LTGTTWFPSTLANAFIPSLRTSFYIGALLSAIAAILSALRGEKYIHEHEVLKNKSETESLLEIDETSLNELESPK
jgi:O-antigen ligase